MLKAGLRHRTESTIGERGAYVLKVPSNEAIAEYAQPGMDGQEPVTYLFHCLECTWCLDGVRLLDR